MNETANGPKIARELEIWMDMTPMQRLAVMREVPFVRSENRRFRGCMEFIRNNMERFDG